MHGVCREGSRCLFSHDPNTSKPSPSASSTRGGRAYGERCRYDHIKSSRGGGASEEPPGNPPVGGAYHDPRQLCPYAAAGQCYYGDSCTYLHGDLCEVCRLQVLHPHDPEQRRAHEKVCKFTSNQYTVCSICMELVVQKLNPCERRFGILSSCCHTFCLTCIRQWRCTRSFSNSIINKKSCKYFDQGRGVCPFGGKCLYLHALPDGTRAEPDRPRKQLSSEGGVRFMNNVRLWDFIEEREQRDPPDISELRDLFMQMSGPGRESEEPPTEEHPLRNTH
ncbi:hypothetical protein F7725_016273 [Dissostichus mawsoni]|uniref:E3 ubiquitin-protein ligase makorin-2 n=1 Tax=Dissostichus mawsoni TaxID=36200 RepID=A0A7J5Z1J2_DISMA|nr:hypothetical protein F7725_016273 [Dissostichus mawsoni]